MTSDGNMILEVVDHASGHLAAGFLSSNASNILQAQGGDHVGIDMPPPEQVPARQPPAPVELIRALWSISLLTLVPAITTALYKPARGVVFAHNKLSYYLALSVIVALGLGEAFTAFWLSRPGGGSRRRLTLGRAVLCASVLPFAAVLGIAGYGFIQG
ncbi:hypothetical protein ACQ4PT_015112 [Festuca glaucescens]